MSHLQEGHGRKQRIAAKNESATIEQWSARIPYVRDNFLVVSTMERLSQCSALVKIHSH
jgi:hypothetical protein